MVLLTVGPSGRAPISVVSELMNMHAALCRGIVAGDVVGDGGGGGLGGLLKGHGAGDLGVATKDSHYVIQNEHRIISAG